MGLWILPWVTVAILSLANIALHALRAQLKKEVFVVWPVPSRTQFRRQLAQSLDPLTTFRIGRDLNEIVLGLALEEKGVWYARPFAAEMIRFSLLFLMLFSSSFTISATIDNGVEMVFLGACAALVVSVVFLFNWWSPYAPSSNAERQFSNSMRSLFGDVDESQRAPFPQIQSLGRVVGQMLSVRFGQLDKSISQGTRHIAILFLNTVVLELLEQFFQQSFDVETGVWQLRLVAHVRDSLEIPRHVTHDFSRATVQNLLKTQPAIDMEDLGRLLDEAGLRAEIASVFTDLKSTELTRARVFGNRLSLYGLENNADG